MKCFALMFVAAITAGIAASAFPVHKDCAYSSTVAYEGGYKFGVIETTEAFKATWRRAQ